MSLEEIKSFEFEYFADFYIEGQTFVIDIKNDALGKQDKCIYIHTLGKEILRIGSSKAPLKKRMRRWEMDVSKSLSGQNSITPKEEANNWKNKLGSEIGKIYARRGSTVTTPVGIFPAYLDEESYLIAKYKPPFNRSHR